MFLIMAVFLRCIYGPELYRIYRIISGSNSKGDLYQGNAIERYSSFVLNSIHAAYNVCIYTSPIILAWLYRRDFYTYDGFIYLSKCVAGMSLLYFSAFYMKGIGRVFNPVYRQFIDVLAKTSRNPTVENKVLLSNYDFFFASWPVDFSVLDTGNTEYVVSQDPTGFVETLKNLPKHIASLMLLHSFGLKLIYPGSIQLLQSSISGPLQDGRAQFIMEKGAKRHKVVTSEGNYIDTIFFDRRGKNTNDKNGNTLVISCDGNAGFYEIGTVGTPVEAGYSVLGWNHPGFGGSSGSPFPQEEANASDAVMQFAIQHLGFKPDEIIIHGWSIGGFTASVLAMNYPDIKGVIIDASFDELLPLAIPRMPNFLAPLVSYSVQRFVSLNIAEQLKKYHGPIQLVRRTMDEMISTDMDNVMSNRGNHLLTKLLQYRYPHLFEKEQIKQLWEFLSFEEPGQIEFLDKFKIDEERMAELVFKETSYPSDIGKEEDMKSEEKTKLVLFLVND